MQAALKLIRGQSDDLARLLKHERQTLAQLSHPGIARLLDGGISKDGRPFLVMDWIDGQTLDVWCRTRQPSLAEILRVFHEACQEIGRASCRERAWTSGVAVGCIRRTGQRRGTR